MIYCVEDDASIRELVVYTLVSSGFAAEGFSEGAPFFEAVRNCVPTLVILDLMLPGEDGISILKKLRASARTKSVPVIITTAKGAEYDKVIGLDSGADDYIAKPFGMMELVSRVRAVLRRTDKSEPRTLTAGCVALSEEKHMVTVNGEEVQLTLREFELLHCLMSHQGLVFTRDKLLESLWGYDFDGETRTVDVHIRTLRRKLGAGGDIIGTVRGVGYRIGESI